MTVEQLAKQIFDECAKDGEDVTMEEALEMAQMEIGAKGMLRGAKAIDTQPKEKKPKVVQVSQEKQELFRTILQNLDRCDGVSRENVQVLRENKLISVQISGKTFKIDIIEHRKKL